MLRIAVGEFRLGNLEKKALMQVIGSGRLSEGKRTFQFERSWAKYIGTKYAIAVNSGTSALIAGLMALKSQYNIKNGAKVITTPLTFIATVNAILHCGLKPVFVDIDREKLVITPKNIEAALRKEKNIVIILPVHLMGYACDMDKINKIARANNLLVMEDAAQAHGTLYKKNRKVGALSNLAIFSFYIAHNIQAGEMGAINTNDYRLFQLVKKIKTHGRMCACRVCSRLLGTCPVLNREDEGSEDLDPRFYHDLIGFNFKIMEFQAALGLTQLKNAKNIFKRRNSNVEYLNKNLSNLSSILQLPLYSENTSFLAYPLVIRNNKVISRYLLRRELEKKGIETRPLFGCIPLQQPAYGFLKEKYKGKLPNAEYIGANGFYIGCHQYLNKADLDYIVKSFYEIFNN